jgi:hypothetical protein
MVFKEIEMKRYLFSWKGDKGPGRNGRGSKRMAERKERRKRRRSSMQNVEQHK